MEYTRKRRTYGVQEYNVRPLRVSLKLNVCGNIGLITLYYLKSLLV